jgi:phosphate acetyltransferase
VKSLSWHDFRLKAAHTPQRIIFADGEDARVVSAAVQLQTEKIVHPQLVGSRKKIEPLWNLQGGQKLELACLDATAFTPTENTRWVNAWQSLPKNKQMTPEEAREKLKDPLNLGCLALKMGQADGFVGGATRTTADTLRAVFNIIGLAPRTSTLFGFFLIEKRPATSGEATGLVLLADCAVIPDPSPKQLCNIGLGSAAAFEFFLQDQPRVAFLSFSTLGSATHPFVDKVREALRMAREKAPQILCDGEWQSDTALDAFTAQIKGASKSLMAGRANVLIVPDLNCGNIAYKLVQRLGQTRAVGPVLWGTAQPANDLSRGCSIEDVIDMAALTALQAQATRLQPVLAQKETK